MKKTDAKAPKTLFSGGVIGKDVVNIVRADRGDVSVAAWRNAKRPPQIGAEPTPRPADPTPVALPPAPTSNASTEYERGFADGQAAAAASAESLMERYDGAIAQLSRALDGTAQAATADAVRVAMQVGARLARKAIAEDPEALALVVAAAVEHTDGADPLTVTCDQKTAALLRLQLDELVSSLGVPEIHVEEDPKLGTGDLMLSRGSTTLDARIDTRAERIAQALLLELGMDAHDGTSNIEAQG